MVKGSWSSGRASGALERAAHRLNLPKRLELLLRVVFAFPNASRIVPVSDITLATSPPAVSAPERKER